MKAVEAAGVPNMVWFNYRRVPAVALAKQLVDEGRVGKAVSLPGDATCRTGPSRRMCRKAARLYGA